MKYLPFAFALLAAPAQSQPLPATFCSAGVIGAAGLGDNGFACSGSSMTMSSPVERLWLITGDNPDSVVTVTVDVKPVVGRNLTAGLYRHGICFGFPAWTMPNYAEGLPIPEWPLVFVDQSADDNASGTATLRIRTLDPLHGFEPNSNYSFNVSCPPRP